nr:leucine-rich repeat-containing protein 3C isoform X1 [Vicugna pacos]
MELGAVDVRRAHPSPAKQGSFCSARLWTKGRGSRRQSLSPNWERRDGGWQRRGLEGKPETGNGIGAWSSHSRVHQGPGSALSWHHPARPWLRCQAGPLVPTWPTWQPPRSYSTPGLCQSVAMLPSAGHLLSLLLVIGTGGVVPSPRVAPQGCYVAEEAGERTFRCSQAGLSTVPTGIPNDTRKLYLDANRLASVPAGAFQHLPVLEELDLSHNVLAHLSGAAFQGLAGTLRHLDLSANQLASVPLEAFVGLQIQVNLSANPWRCDCALQELLRRVRLAPGTGTGIVCGPGARPDLVGQEFLALAGEEELCGTGRGGARRSTDVALLVTMGGWLVLVVAYLAHYVWQNREETRRPLKRAPVLPVRSEDSSTLSTVV